MLYALANDLPESLLLEIEAAYELDAWCDAWADTAASSEEQDEDVWEMAA